MTLQSFEFANYRSVESALREAITTSTPFSLIRCGDGESVVLGFPDFVHQTRFISWMENFFGPQANDLLGYIKLREMLRGAVRNADILGTYRLKVDSVKDAQCTALTLGSNSSLTNEQKIELNKIEWCLLESHIRPLLSDTSIVVSTNIHIRLEESGALSSIIESCRNLNIITGNDIKDKIMSKFKTVNINQRLIPTEYKFRDVKCDFSTPHFPDVFYRIITDIQAGNFGGVTLIGAGPCGKIYASAIKQAGGVAIDIGSIMDVWAGRHTRSFMSSIRRKTFCA